MDFVNSEIIGRIGFVILNRPDKRNALNPQLVNEVTSVMKEFNANETIRVIVIKSSDKPFCAGADLSYIKALSDFTFEENLEDSNRLKHMFELIYNSPKITISQVEGPAIAGGCGLAQMTDFCFASDEAIFGYSEVKIGFIPALVMVYLREKIGMNLLNKWLLTGSVFAADEALKDGLIYKISTPEKIESEVIAFADKIASSTSGDSIRLTKLLMREIPPNRLNALELAAKSNAEARQTGDCKRGISSFLNKERIKW